MISLQRELPFIKMEFAGFISQKIQMWVGTRGRLGLFLVGRHEWKHVLVVPLIEMVRKKYRKEGREGGRKEGEKKGVKKTKL